MQKTPREYDYNTFGEKFKTLIAATAYKLEREWPEHRYPVDSARVVFVILIRTALNTYNSMMYLCADIPEDCERKTIYRVSLPPLTRTIYEMFATEVFLLDDIPNNVPLLFKTWYYDKRRALDHCQEYYTTSADWQTYIKRLSRLVTDEEKRLNLSANEILDPKKFIGLWPTPGAALDKIKKSHPLSPIIPFLKFLNSWMYRELSGLTHFGASALVEFGWLFSPESAEQYFGDEAEDRINAHLDKIRNEQLHTAFAILLALISEIEIHFSFGLKDRIRELWILIGGYGDTTKEVYEARYEDYFK